MRSLLRTRKQFVREQTRHVQRIQKTLEESNIKLDAVISDILGVNGRRMIEAMIAGESNPQKLAALADRRLKASPTELRDALHGRLTQTHRFLLRTHLKQWDALDATPAPRPPPSQGQASQGQASQGQANAEIDRQVDVVISGMVQPVRFRALIILLCTIPGVGKLAAITILAEIGPDPRIKCPGAGTPFRTAGHLVAWAGLCPGQNQSAGKRKSSRLRKGAPWLKTMLVQCAWAAKRQKNSYYRAQFYRLAGRRGPQKAICAVAASTLTAVYHMLKDGTQHVDLGADYFDRRPTEAKARRLVAQLNKLGYEVQIQPIAAAA